VANVRVGNAAKRHIRSLRKEVVKLHYGPRHGFQVKAKPADRNQKNRVLEVGLLAKARLRVMRGRVVDVHWSGRHGFWVTTERQKPSKRQIAVRYANQSLKYAGRMVYDEGPLRAELFNHRPGDFVGAHADCSQFVSAIMHWSGVSAVDQWDDTGTLLDKGKPVTEPGVARLIIAGPGTGVHVGMFTAKADGVWQIVEFGKQSAPDRISLPDFIAYFRRVGVFEFRYRDFYE
jgi:hypothetical protein